jgi:hypothetical protein
MQLRIPTSWQVQLRSGELELWCLSETRDSHDSADTLSPRMMGRWGDGELYRKRSG